MMNFCCIHYFHTKLSIIRTELYSQMKLNFQKSVFTFLSLTCVMVEKVLFLREIFEAEILMDLHVMRTYEFENHIFSVWSLCLCVHVPVISITDNTNYSRNMKFDILYLYYTQILSETFYKDRTKILYTDAHKIILIH